MTKNTQITPIATIRNGFSEKFGIPRQSGLTHTLSRIVFNPEYRNPDAVRGLDGFSHIWLLWLFSEAEQKDWSPTVRPPKLGGNTRMGVFATRSPFRPNSIGLSSVRLKNIIYDAALGPVLEVEGADILDGTPIIDVKPYLPYTDSHADACGGFALQQTEGTLAVSIPDKLAAALPPSTAQEITEILAQDPRPAYHNDPERIYGLDYGDYRVRFTVSGHLLTVVEVSIRK